MANYPQLDNARGVWNMKEVYDAVMGGYWPNALSRGVFAGGAAPSASNVIDYITIATTGDATDFGDMTGATEATGAAASFTRLLIAGEESPASTDIDYVTIMSTGNAADFGDLTVGRGLITSNVSNSVRGLFCGGATPTYQNVIDYATMAST